MKPSILTNNESDEDRHEINESHYFHVRGLFLLSSDIRSEGSIAIVKKLDFDFL